MERLKHIKETLMNCVQGQIGDLSSVDSKELGEVIDMIKDLEEAIYYKTITEAMHSKEKEEKYYPYNYRMPDDRQMDMNQGRMYYGDGKENYYSRGNNGGSGGNGGIRQYPLELRDSREGVSPMVRRKYMESKELHKGKEARMGELDHYMQELSHDITEMINDASLEEKQMLQDKLTKLVHKIV